MKNYGVRFGSGDPRTFTGLTPTFLIFVNMASGATIAPPSISEVITGSGIYTFQWGTTTPIAFLVDGATASIPSSGRYVSGQLDPADRADELAGSVGSTFGGVATDPVDLFGYMKRIQELLEGANTFYKASGAFSLYSRGSSTLLRTLTVANSVSLVSRG